MKYYDFKLGVTLLLSVFIISCSNKDEFDNEVIKGGYEKDKISLSVNEFISIAYPADTKLTKEETEEILKDFADNTHSNPVIKSGNDPKMNFVYEGEVIIEKGPSVKSGNSQRNTVTFHKYSLIPNATKSNTENTDGYAVVCADSRFPNVIAYAEGGNIENSMLDGSGMMLETSKRIALGYIQKINHIEDSLRTITINKICEELNISSEGFSIDNKIIADNISVPDVLTKTGPSNPTGSFITAVGPLTRTAWNQNAPYNLFIRKYDDPSHGSYFGSSYEGRYPTGCVITTMAQITAYFKPTIRLNRLGKYADWNTILATTSVSNSNQSTEQVQQVAALMEQIGLNSDTKWGTSGGSTNSGNAIKYMNSIGIYFSGQTSMLFQNMKSSLDALRLIYATGTCRSVNPYSFSAKNLSSKSADYTNGSHAWIIDGYQIRERPSRKILRERNVWAHCNFGWGPWRNAYFLFQSDGSITFDIDQFGSTDVYDINLRIYPNVRR